MVRPPQWLHGFLELCLLALLADEPDYGYGLIQRLAAAGLDELPGGTLYPALLRLEQQGHLSSSWATSPTGPRRKYYRITPGGLGALEESVLGWRVFSGAIDRVVAGAGAGSGAGEGPGAAGPAAGSPR